MKELQKQPPTAVNVKALNKEKQDLSELLQRQEIMCRQRSRVEQLKEGDFNTSFFRGRATTRKKKTEITRVKKDNGEWACDMKTIEDMANKYFMELFTTTNPTKTGHGGSLGGSRCPHFREMSLFLDTLYTTLEVKEALLQMGPTKTPGPDGMPALFYPKYQSILGEDVTVATLEFLNGEGDLEIINQTNISMQCALQNYKQSFR